VTALVSSWVGLTKGVGELFVKLGLMTESTVNGMDFPSFSAQDAAKKMDRSKYQKIFGNSISRFKKRWKVEVQLSR
jgi:hypothetical protein